MLAEVEDPLDEYLAEFIPTTSPTGITCISDIFISSPFTAIVNGI